MLGDNKVMWIQIWISVRLQSSYQVGVDLLFKGLISIVSVYMSVVGVKLPRATKHPGEFDTNNTHYGTIIIDPDCNIMPMNLVHSYQYSAY